MQAVKRQQVDIEIIPEDAEGDIDIDALEELVSSGTGKPALIALTHIPTSSGKQQPCFAQVVHLWPSLLLLLLFPFASILFLLPSPFLCPAPSLPSGRSGAKLA